MHVNKLSQYNELWYKMYPLQLMYFNSTYLHKSLSFRPSSLFPQLVTENTHLFNRFVTPQEALWNHLKSDILLLAYKKEPFSGRIIKYYKIRNWYHRTILSEKAFLGHVHKSICNILSLFNAMNVKNVWRHRNLLSAVLVEEGVVEVRWRVITLGCSDFLYPLFSVTEPEDILRRIEALLLIGDDELKFDRRVWKMRKKNSNGAFFLVRQHLCNSTVMRTIKVAGGLRNEGFQSFLN